MWGSLEESVGKCNFVYEFKLRVFTVGRVNVEEDRHVHLMEGSTNVNNRING